MPLPEQLKNLYDEQFSHELPAFDLSGVVRQAKARRRRRRIGSAVGAALASVGIVAATAGVLESRSATAVPAVVAPAHSPSTTYTQDGDAVTVERDGKVIGRITVVTADFEVKSLMTLKYMTIRAKDKLMDIDPVTGAATPSDLKLLVLKVRATEKFSISTGDFVGENQSSKGSTEELTTGRRTFQVDPGAGDRDYYWGYRPLPSNKLYWVPDAKAGIAAAWTIDDGTVTLTPGQGLTLPADAVTMLRKGEEALKFRGSKPSGS